MIYVMINEENQIIGAVDTKRVVAFVYDGTSSDYVPRYILKLDYGHTLTVDTSDMQNILSAMMKDSGRRKPGKWILADTYDGRKRYRCSECLAFALKTDDGKENLSDYCSVCGAEMKGETDEQRTGN